MLTTTEWRLVRDYVQTALNRFTSVGPFPSWRPGTMTGESGLPAAAGVDCFVKLDGDTAPIPAQNISGLYLTDGQRVMTVFSPPHACFVVGPITGWPVEQGMLGSTDWEITASTWAGSSTVSTSWAEVSTNARTVFVAPSSGRVRFRVTGILAGSTGQAHLEMAVQDVAVGGTTAFADSHHIAADLGSYNVIVFEAILSSLTPGTAYTVTPVFRLDSAVGTGYIWNGADGGKSRCEVWAMPPASD